MSEDVEDFLRVGIHSGGNLFGSFGLPGFPEVGGDADLEFDDFGGGFFSGLDSRLVVGIDVDERSVKPDGAFVEGDEGAELEGIELGDAERDGFAAVFVKGGASAAEKPLEVIAGRDARLDFERGRGAALRTSMNVTKKLLIPSRSCWTYACWSVEPLFP